MKRRKLAVTAVWAFGAFATTLAFALPATLNATDQSTAKTTVDQPSLTAHGIRFTVGVADVVLGQPVKVTLNATNSGTTAATATYTLQMYSTNRAAMESRTLPAPVQTWTSNEQTLTLAAGETRQIQMDADALKSTGLINLVMHSGDQAVSVYNGVARVQATAAVSPTTQPAPQATSIVLPTGAAVVRD